MKNLYALFIRQDKSKSRLPICCPIQRTFLGESSRSPICLIICTRTQTATLGPDEPEYSPHDSQLARGHIIRNTSRLSGKSHETRSRVISKGRVFQTCRVGEGLHASFKTTTSRNGNFSHVTTPKVHSTLLNYVSSRLIVSRETSRHISPDWTDYLWIQGPGHKIWCPFYNYGITRSGSRWFIFVSSMSICSRWFLYNTGC